MRIFVVSRGNPTPQFPQWGCFERDQAEALAAIGHEVVMISVDTRFRLVWRKPGFTYVEQAGVKSVSLYYCPSAFILEPHLRSRFDRWELYHVYQEAARLYGTPDIIYSHYLFKNADAVWLGKITNIPVAGIEHWSELNKRPLPRRVRELGNRTYRQLDVVLAVSESLSHSIQESFGKMKIEVVHNMATKEFAYAEPMPHPLTFISTGSLIHRKGFDLLPEAFSGVKNLPCDWRMLIIGGGKEKKRLQHQIDQMGLTEHILLIGQKSKEDILPLLQQADAFILPSRNENFSVAVLEALACGVPVISSICGGIKECINEQNGLLFEVDDIEELRNAIQTMVDHPNKFDHQAIADDYQKRFSPEVIARQLTHIFEETIQKHHKQA